MQKYIYICRTIARTWVPHLASALLLAGIFATAVLAPVTLRGVATVDAFSFFGIGDIATDVLDDMFSWVLGKVGGLLVTIAAYILWMTGSIFDLLIQLTIVNFKGTLETLQILPNIETVWTAFRDIANIVIIGMFIFVALATILGLTDYGYKNFVSRILIVAILINFSLFFSKAIIDTSHLVALQFYQSIGAVAGPSSSGAADISSAAGASQRISEHGGISGAFMARAGVQSSLNGFEAVGQARDTNEGSRTAAVFIYSTAAVMLFLTLAVLFAYGSFLLASRAILLVFLMITSALAFVSYLIPGFSGHKYGWRGWWEALLKSAVFAPMLLLFLWATLFILQPAQGNRTFAEFIANPGDTNRWSVMVLFIFTIGMLYLSIKLAKEFSTSITGFQIAAKLPAAGLLGGSALAGFAGRHTAGKISSALGRQIGKLTNYLDDDASFRGAKTLGKGAAWTRRRTESLAGSDFNLAKTGIGKEIAGLADMDKKRFESKVGGATGVYKRSGEFYAKEAAAREPTDEQKKKVKEALEAEQQPTRDRADQVIEGRKAQKAGGEAALEQARQDLADRKAQYEEEVADLEREIDDIRSDGTISDTARNNEIAAKRSDQQNAKSRLAADRVAIQSSMQQEEERIRKAQRSIERNEQRLTQLQKKVEGDVRYKRATDTGARAEGLAHNRGINWLSPDIKKDPVAQSAKKAVGDLGQKKRISQLFSSDDAKAAMKENMPPSESGGAS